MRADSSRCHLYRFPDPANVSFRHSARTLATPGLLSVGGGGVRASPQSININTFMLQYFQHACKRTAFDDEDDTLRDCLNPGASEESHHIVFY